MYLGLGVKYKLFLSDFTELELTNSQKLVKYQI